MQPVALALISSITLVLFFSLLFRFSNGASSVIKAGTSGSNTIIRSLAAE